MRLALARGVLCFFLIITVIILSYSDWFAGLSVWQQFLSFLFLALLARVGVILYARHGIKKGEYEREGGGEGFE